MKSWTSSSKQGMDVHQYAEAVRRNLWACPIELALACELVGIAAVLRDRSFEIKLAVVEGMQPKCIARRGAHYVLLRSSRGKGKGIFGDFIALHRRAGAKVEHDAFDEITPTVPFEQMDCLGLRA